MKRVLVLLFFVFTFTMGAIAQVTIGSQDAPEEGAILELRSDTLGFLPPRVALSKLSLPDPLSAHIQGMVVFNTYENLSDTLQTGLYYNTGIQWVRLSANPYFIDGWFFMPSVVFNTTEKGTFSMDLYEKYKNQFENPKVKNQNAPNSVSPVAKATDLNYYVLDYDDQVFTINSISNDGVMNYTIEETATDATFINIVFVEK